ncbi:MAG: 60S ribosomal protein L31 [Thaumarchaeota archaeon]|nr:60S ribosomal protein L31 [Nitrososphaerota archaeon]
MSQELERVYTINLGKVLLSPNNRRSKRAINMIREFARHHMKTEDVKIDEELAHQIWKRGIRHPPRKIRVMMTKTDEGFVLISPYEEEELETKVEPKEKSKKTTAKEKLAEKSKKTTAKEKLAEKPKKTTAKEKLAEKLKKATAKEEPAEKPKKASAKEDLVEKPKKASAKEELVEKPKLADFVDPKKGTQHYIDRYNKEKKYKAWFDKNYPNLTIEEAVGLKPTKTKEKPKKAPTKEEKPKKKSN